jgi:hypothetical protein
MSDSSGGQDFRQFPYLLSGIGFKATFAAV